MRSVLPRVRRRTARPAGRLILSAGFVLGAGGLHGQQEVVLYEGTFELPAGGTLEAGVADMDIEVTAGAGPARVTVTGRGRDMAFARRVFEASDFRADLSGGTLRITSEDPRVAHDQWRRYGGVGLRVSVTVPEETPVELATGDGDIGLRGTRGTARVRTADGDVRIHDVHGPDLWIQTSDGDVNAARISADEIEIRTSDGDLHLVELAGPLTASTSDGDVVIDLTRFEGLSVRSGDGDVHVRMDPDAHADVELEGEEVSVSREFAITGRLRERRVEGTLNGGGAPLTIRVNDGDVRLRSR